MAVATGPPNAVFKDIACQHSYRYPLSCLNTVFDNRALYVGVACWRGHSDSALSQDAGKRSAGASKRQHTAHLTHGTVRYLSHV